MPERTPTTKLQKAHPDAINRVPPPVGVSHSPFPLSSNPAINGPAPPFEPRRAPPPQSTSHRQPVHTPRGNSTARNREGGRPSHHLRQRSTAKDEGPGASTLVDGKAARQGPNLAHAAMMGAAMDPFADNAEDLGSSIAHNMRNARAEWTPTQQYLYSDSALSHSSTASLPLPFGPSFSSSHRTNTSPTSGLASNIVADASLLKAYSAFAYSAEADNALHDAGPPGKRWGVDRRIEESDAFRGSVGFWTWRGWLNLGALATLSGALVFIFAGLPTYSYYKKIKMGSYGATGLGGTNATGQVPDIAGFRGLIDGDTPDSALTRTGFDGKPYQLVFSDEDGRSFEPGLDPYFEANDLWYWYDPGQITTKDGYLEIQLTKEDNASSHNRGYLGGMLQSWNKFCFTGGFIEVAVSLPGDTKVAGLWPAAWTMSNLGRAGYGGSLHGTWPYVYEECDIGTLANQTGTDGLPLVVQGTGDQYHDDSLSYLPGQRLSSCTCSGENHPGPTLANGSFVGRGASEIDIFEATVVPAKELGEISQSGQWAPFNPSYEYINDSTTQVEFFDNTYDTVPNSYLGGAYQQVTSGLSHTDSATYNSTTNFASYGFEYMPSYMDGWGNGRITWTQGGKQMWRISDTAMSANAQAGVSNRVVTGEPMYIIFNLGMSENFGAVDLDNLVFPSIMRVDYVRIYQDNDHINIGCDPPDYPTADYIANNPEMYYNPNITVLADIGQSFPKNRLIDNCT